MLRFQDISQPLRSRDEKPAKACSHSNYN